MALAMTGTGFFTALRFNGRGIGKSGKELRKSCNIFPDDMVMHIVTFLFANDKSGVFQNFQVYRNGWFRYFKMARQTANTHPFLQQKLHHLQPDGMAHRFETLRYIHDFLLQDNIAQENQLAS